MPIPFSHNVPISKELTLIDEITNLRVSIDNVINSTTTRTNRNRLEHETYVMPCSWTYTDSEGEEICCDIISNDGNEEEGDDLVENNEDNYRESNQDDGEDQFIQESDGGESNQDNDESNQDNDDLSNQDDDEEYSNHNDDPEYDQDDASDQDDYVDQEDDQFDQMIDVDDHFIDPDYLDMESENIDNNDTVVITGADDYVHSDWDSESSTDTSVHFMAIGELSDEVDDCHVWSYFQMSREDSDLQLLVDGRILYADSKYIFKSSKILKQRAIIAYSKSSNNSAVIVCPEMSLIDAISILKHVHPTLRLELNESNFVSMIYLSKVYDIPTLFSRCCAELIMYLSNAQRTIKQIPNDSSGQQFDDVERIRIDDVDYPLHCFQFNILFELFQLFSDKKYPIISHIAKFIWKFRLSSIQKLSGFCLLTEDCKRRLLGYYYGISGNKNGTV
ncbi:hypothetical protein GJ496_004548 [Pomphorhynchus laevis]|nr:hypothetical protein GJ496_004548 [Pomphorhynchus laevis]